MTLKTLIENLGSDADLLVKSDKWLEEERKICANNMDELAEKMRALMLAQSIKKLLQDRNMVALQELKKDKSGNIEDIIINLSKLPNALKAIQDPKDTDEQINAATQLYAWYSDGYDIKTSNFLNNK
jgi:hypothetical protein